MSESFSSPRASSSPQAAAYGQAPTNPYARTPSGRPADELGGEGPERGLRPVVLVAIIAVAVLVVGIAAFLLFGGGGGDDTSTAAAPPVPTVTPTPGPAPTPQETLPDTFDGVSGTDPFRPLVAPLVAASGVAGGAQGGPMGATGGAVGAIPGLPGPGSGGSGSGSPPASPAPAPVHLALTDVTVDNAAATFAVNGSLIRVGVGDKFAERFRLLRLEGGRCATVQYGDEGVDLCEGDQLQL